MRFLRWFWGWMFGGEDLGFFDGSAPVRPVVWSPQDREPCATCGGYIEDEETTDDDDLCDCDEVAA